MKSIKETNEEWLYRFFFDHGFLRSCYQNYWKIDENMYRSAQPSPAMFYDLKQKGFKTIINLRGSRDDLVDQMERRICNNLNLKLIDYKMLSRAAPLKEQIIDAKELFKTIKYPALLHCKSGADRTGIMAALYLIFKGQKVSHAKSQLSFKYLHIKLAKSGILDAFFEKYLSDQKDYGQIDFWDWVYEKYNSNELQRSFKVNIIRTFFDKITNRE